MVSLPAAQEVQETEPVCVALPPDAAPKVVAFCVVSADAFAVPELTDWQRRILTTAVSYVGFPYVWGGTSPGPETPAGVPAVGGFDCSGFVWRVYKLTPYAGAGRLASTLAGRTTFQMAAESTRQMKIFKAQNLKPGDVLLFGHGPASKSAEIVDRSTRPCSRSARNFRAASSAGGPATAGTSALRGSRFSSSS